MSTDCFICGGGDGTGGDEGDIVCRVCGHYQMPFELQVNIERDRRKDPRLLAALSAATRQANLDRRILSLTTENYLLYAEAHRWTSVPRKIQMALEALGRRSAWFGQAVELDHTVDYPLFDAVSPHEALALIRHLDGVQVINLLGANMLVITGKGWEALEPTRFGGIQGRCFVAMAFDPELDYAYYNGIKLALLDCGYTPVCLKEIGTNNDICDLILSEIRKAQFLVADFTKQKGGVYFEAGFGKAFGKEVFWTCRGDDFANLHFDTNHYGHIKWTTPGDLRRQLRDRITAELGLGPHGIAS